MPFALYTCCPLFSLNIFFSPSDVVSGPPQLGCLQLPWKFCMFTFMNHLEKKPGNLLVTLVHVLTFIM